MVNLVRHVLRVIHAKLRGAANVVRRPAAVTSAQHRHLKADPECSACGITKGGQAHHIKPYHKYPDLAAAPENFITLCETVGGPECHLHIGHGGNFKMYNPNVVADAQAHKQAKTPAARGAVVDQAKAARLPDEP